MVHKHNHETPIKILHVVHSLEIGGLENGVINIINCLRSERFLHTICCLTRSGKLARRIEPKGTEIVELGFPSDGLKLPWLSLARVFRRLSPDVIHTRGWGTVDAVFAARLAHVPRMIHGEHGRDCNDREGVNWRRNQIRRLVGLAVDRYVTVCDFFSHWLRDTCKVREDKIVHIPNGVDTTKFAPLAAKRSMPGALSSELRALRQKVGLPGEGAVVGSVGRLDPVKDFATLLRGFAGIRRHFPEACLAIVGDGPVRNELVRLTGNLGLTPYVYWLGERQDVPSLLRCFDVFVQTSLFEGMSNTILEAMATGLPVIATATGGNDELITSGRTGALIPVGDCEALSRCLATYLADLKLCDDHGARSREKVLSNFDLSLMAYRYAALYEGKALP